MSSIYDSDDGIFQYSPLTRKHMEASLNMVRDSFVKNENICKACRLSDDPEALEEFVSIVVRPAIEEGLSLIAIEKSTGEIAGVAINKINVKPSPGLDLLKSFVEAFKRPASRDIAHAIAVLETSFNVFELATAIAGVDDNDKDKSAAEDNNCVFELFILSTLSKYRGKGIAKKLSEISIEIATALSKGKLNTIIHTNDFKTESIIKYRPKLVTSIFTSFITQRIGKLLQFTVATRKSFDSFTTHRGETYASIIDDPNTSDVTFEYRVIV